MIVQFSQGAAYVWRGMGLLNRPGVRRFVIIPLLINILVFAAAIGVSVYYIDAWFDHWLPRWLEWLRWILWPLFALATLLIVFYSFTLIANVIAAPFNGLLAERIEAEVTGTNPPSFPGWRAFLTNAISAVLNELRKLVYFLVRAVPLLILFFIPGLNLAAPFLWFIFGAWMLALEYADAPMGNYALGFQDGRRLMTQHRLLALGFGSAMSLLTLIPVVNFLAMPTGVVGATVMWVERLRTQTLLGKSYESMSPAKRPANKNGAQRRRS